MPESAIKVRITPHLPPDNSLDIRLTPGLRNEFKGVAKAGGLGVSDVVEFAAGSDLAVVALTLGPGAPLVPAIADVIKTWLTRHENASVEFVDGKVRKASGYSLKEVTRFVEDAATKKAELDQAWRDSQTRRNGPGGTD